LDGHVSSSTLSSCASSSSNHFTRRLALDQCLWSCPYPRSFLHSTSLQSDLIKQVEDSLIYKRELFCLYFAIKVSNDPFEDAEVTAPTHSSFWVKCKEMKPYFLDTLAGRGKSPFRTGNIFQTLSSVTVINNIKCVDKN
jgi:hypothetical protein